MASNLAALREAIVTSNDAKFLQDVIDSDLSKAARDRLQEISVAETAARTPAERALASIIGGFVADAAVQSVQWVYDEETIKTKLHPQSAKLPFSEQHLCPFFKVGVGESTAYGDQARAALVAIHSAVTADSKKGDGSQSLFDPSAYESQLVAIFGNDSAYGPWPVPKGAEDKDKFPLPHKWRNHSIKSFLGTGKPQADDHQLDSAAKVPAIVASLHGIAPEQDILNTVEKIVGVTQDSDQAVAAATIAADVLAALLKGLRTKDALAAALDTNSAEQVGERVAEREDSEATAAMRKLIAEALEAWRNQASESPTPFVDFALKNGIGCRIPGSIINALAVFSESGDLGYEQTVQRAISCGGDVVSRSIVSGALAAAVNGVASIPTEWIKKTKGLADVVKLARDILSKHPNADSALKLADQLLSTIEA